MTQIVYLNGDFLPIEQAKISVMDRGFLFGDGVFEVIPIYSGKPFRLREHLHRLQTSLDSILLKYKVDCDFFAKIVSELLQKNFFQNPDQDFSIYLEITRGAASERTYSFPDKTNPTIFAAIKPVKRISIEELTKGKSAITLQDIRWKDCYIKSISLLAGVLLSQQAKEAGADEAILIRHGFAIEGASSNLFIVKDGVIITPPLSRNTLSGITREMILKIIKDQKLAFKETSIKLSELKQADEVWVSSSTRTIFPITKLNGKSVGNGKVGQIWQKIIKSYFIFSRQE